MAASFYAEFNSAGKFVQEKQFSRPLKDDEILKFPDGKPSLKPLEVEIPVYNSETEREAGYQYIDRGSKVIKKLITRKLTQAEINNRAARRRRELQELNIPGYYETIPRVAGILLSMIERFMMTQDPKDPRTKVNISDADIEELKKIQSAGLTINQKPTKTK